MIALARYPVRRAVRLVLGPALATLIKLRVDNPDSTSEWLAAETSHLSGDRVDRKQVSRTLLEHGIPTALARTGAGRAGNRRPSRVISPDALAALLEARVARVRKHKIREQRSRRIKGPRVLKWYTDRYRKEWRRLLHQERGKAGRDGGWGLRDEG